MTQTSIPRPSRHGRWAAAAVALLATVAPNLFANPIDADKAKVIEHWDSQHRASAIPRDLVIDPRGLGYLRRPGGFLEPYGHDKLALEADSKPVPSPFGKPVGGGDTTPPVVGVTDPAAGSTVTAASYTFTAMVTDDTGVASVDFKLKKDTSSIAQSFATTRVGTTIQWAVSLSGLSNGDWTWWVEAKDSARNAVTSTATAFKVNIGGSSGGVSGDSVPVVNAAWTVGGTVQTAAGRIYFEMPAKSPGKWTGYVCSGTVAKDDASVRSVIITAAHCVYDDVKKKFARNVLFIPNQAATTGTGTDRDCSNDPLGCWVPSFGVVDTDWTIRTFPDNVAWDYAFYVVPDSGAHQRGFTATTTDDALDGAVAPMSVSFAGVQAGVSGSPTDLTHALGYSYSEDPKFMYCAEDLTNKDAANWWLASCGLSGGSSGGPWVQPMDTGSGDGPIISVNSWGYTNQPGMAGPKLVGTSAACVFGFAKSSDLPASLADGYAGVVASCQP